MEDVDGDGALEALVSDDTFENELGLDHADSPGVTIIYKLTDGRFVEASADYPQYYDPQISEIEAQLSQPPAIPTERLPDGSTEERPDSADLHLVARAIKVFLLYQAEGNTQTGWERYKELMRPDQFLTEAWKQRVPANNVLMAHAYGFEDFGAQRYLHRSEYRAELQSRIGGASDVFAPMALPRWHQEQLLKIGESGNVTIRYHSRLDYFELFYDPRQVNLDPCSNEATALIQGVLGVQDISRLPIYDRILNGC